MKIEKDLKIGIFVYNFKHRKSQDFLVRSYLENLNVQAVFAADAVKLNIEHSTIKTKIRHQGLMHPERVSQRFEYKYFNFPHNDKRTIETIKKLKLDIGIVAGARILNSSVISAFNIGIINFHPGLIPETRGLDSLLWSIINDIPIGVTSHLIDARIDAGTVLIKDRLKIYKDDTIYDLSERLYEKQLELLIPSINSILEEKYIDIDYSNSSYNRKMRPELEKDVLRKVKKYIEKYSE